MHEASPDKGSSMMTEGDAMDFRDILMDNMSEVSKLDIYLSQLVEKVKDAITWWWNHCGIFPRLSVMVLDYLSALGKYFSI
jgi:predicted metal-dependent hydrolase